MTVEAAEKLEQLFRDELNVRVENITRDSRLVDDLGLDSVAFAVGLVAIEEHFGVALNEDQLFACNTFGDLVDIVETGTVAAAS